MCQTSCPVIVHLSRNVASGGILRDEYMGACITSKGLYYLCFMSDKNQSSDGAEYVWPFAAK